MPTSDWTPEVQDVADLLRARTKDKTGSEVGTFTSATRPTDSQVDDLITKAVRDVARVVGDEIPQTTWEDANDVVALGAALKVELSYFPEQINSGRSPYPQMKTMYDQQIKDLLTEIEKENSGDTSDPGAPMKPKFNFSMTPDPFIIGRSTRW